MIVIPIPIPLKRKFKNPVGWSFFKKKDPDIYYLPTLITGLVPLILMVAEEGSSITNKGLSVIKGGFKFVLNCRFLPTTWDPLYSNYKVSEMSFCGLAMSGPKNRESGEFYGEKNPKNLVRSLLFFYFVKIKN